VSTLAAEASPVVAIDGGERPRLLFLCQTLPYPPDGGVNIRTFNVLRLLAAEFDVTALCFFRATECATPEQRRLGVEGLRPLAETEVFPIPQEHSRLRYLADHLRSVAGGRAYTIRAYESRDFRRRVEELVRTRRFDLVHLDSMDLVGYLPALRGLPVVCVHHNVESELLRRRAGEERNPLASAYLRHQATLVRREERRGCPAVSLNVAVSAGDRDALATLAPGARWAVVSNGVDTARFAPAPPGRGDIVFVGGISWFPNADAMRWFTAEVLPLLRARGICNPVRWVGRAPDAVRDDQLRRSGVEMTGYVDDVRPYLAAASCFVAPLRVGGGTRLKILDAWAAGKAVVSTSVGCEGLDARHGENLLVADTAAEFADAVARVLADDELRRRLGTAARRTAEERYDWRVIGRGMLAEYRRLLPAGRRGRSRTRVAVATLAHGGEPRRTAEVSFIVPVYNAMPYLPRTVPALLAAARRHGAAEVVFVDNGSVDGSYELLSGHASDTVRVFRLPGATIAAVRNEGARHATGDFLAFVDADCVVADEYLRHAVAELERTGAAATGCEVAAPAPAHWIEGAWHALHYTGRDGGVHYLNAANFFISRTAFEAVGGFRESLATGEDAEICDRLRAGGHRMTSCTGVGAVHLGNPKSVRQFYRRSVWHALGMFATVGGTRFDRPTAMMAAHAAATLAGLALLLLPGIALATASAGAAALQLAVPGATVAFRAVQARRRPPVIAGITLYWLYYWARLQAVALIAAGRSHRYRK
jgi:glycosyltransferase involved in cell wall biosynthesis